MTLYDRYEFRAANAADFDLLRSWRSRSHVLEWWDALERDEFEAFDDTRVAKWIVKLEGRPFAFIQDYTVHGWDDHHFFHLPKGSRGIDQFIGEPDMIGKGHGSTFIAQHVRRLFDKGAPVVATDPHPDNARAIAACEKAGFSRAGPPQESPWGLILPMTVNR